MLIAFKIWPECVLGTVIRPEVMCKDVHDNCKDSVLIIISDNILPASDREGRNGLAFSTYKSHLEEGDIKLQIIGLLDDILPVCQLLKKKISKKFS